MKRAGCDEIGMNKLLQCHIIELFRTLSIGVQYLVVFADMFTSMALHVHVVIPRLDIPATQNCHPIYRSMYPKVAEVLVLQILRKKNLSGSSPCESCAATFLFCPLWYRAYR
eukprot:3011230-Amphidinium_carterae.1